MNNLLACLLMAVLSTLVVANSVPNLQETDGLNIEANEVKPESDTRTIEGTQKNEESIPNLHETGELKEVNSPEPTETHESTHNNESPNKAKIEENQIKPEYSQPSEKIESSKNGYFTEQVGEPLGQTEVVTKSIYDPILDDTVETSEPDLQADMKQAMLNCMNKYRNKHHSGPLSFAPWLQKQAQNWADYLAKTNQFIHQKSNSKFGENLYAFWSSNNQSPPADGACQSWYNEVKFYDYKKGQFSMQTGHFTQLVWKSSKQVGVGVASKNGRWVVVADFYPPGNYAGQFRNNVLPP